MHRTDSFQQHWVYDDLGLLVSSFRNFSDCADSIINQYRIVVVHKRDYVWDYAAFDYVLEVFWAKFGDVRNCLDGNGDDVVIGVLYEFEQRWGDLSNYLNAWREYVSV